MAPHIQTALILLGALALVIFLLVFIHNRDRKKENTQSE